MQHKTSIVEETHAKKEKMSCNIVITSDDEGDLHTSLPNDVSNWSLVPEPVFLTILNYLTVRDILNAGECCRRWNDITKDDYLWKKIFQRDFKVDSVIGLKPGECFCHLDVMHLLQCTRKRTLCASVHVCDDTDMRHRIDIVMRPCPSNPIFNRIDIGCELWVGI